VYGPFERVSARANGPIQAGDLLIVWSALMWVFDCRWMLDYHARLAVAGEMPNALALDAAGCGSVDVLIDATPAPTTAIACDHTLDAATAHAAAHYSVPTIVLIP